MKKKGKELKKILKKGGLKPMTATASQMIRGYTSYSEGFDVAQEAKGIDTLRIDFKGIKPKEIIKILKKNKCKFTPYKPNKEITLFEDVECP